MPLRPTKSSNRPASPAAADAPPDLHASLLDQAPNPVVAWRLGGTIVYWNDSARRLYGYTRAEAVGRRSHELLQTEFPDGMTFADVEAALTRNGAFTGEFVHVARDHRRLIVDANLRVTRLPTDRDHAAHAGHAPRPDPIVLASDRDVTERKRAARESTRWARQHERVAALAHMSLDGAGLDALLAAAVRQLADELAVQHVEVCGIAPAADRRVYLKAGSGFLRQAVPDPDQLAAALAPQAAFTIAAGEPVVSPDLARERRFTVPDALRNAGAAASMSVAISGHPHPIGALAVYCRAPREFANADLSFLRAVANLLGASIRSDRADRALRESEARMRAVVDTVLEGIITIDESGSIDSANPAACRLFGYDRTELLGRNVNLLMPEPYRAEHDGYLLNYLRTGRARIIGIGREVTGLKKDGTRFPLELGVSEFRSGNTRMFAGVLRDMTEQRRLEREILDIGSQEQRRIGQDLHDGLCQELTGITFALEVLGQKLANRHAPETPGIRKVAELVDQSISHARALAHGLQPVTLDADGLAAALRELAAKVESMFHVSCPFVCESDVLVHDNLVATHLFRIAQEAITNAVKHGKARTIVLELAAVDGWLRLTVSDDGVGLGNAAPPSPPPAPHTPSPASRGIGLQTMLYRARVVGGRLDVRPGDRGGTVVTCAVPLRPAAADEPERKPPHAPKKKNLPRRRSPDGSRTPRRAH